MELETTIAHTPGASGADSNTTASCVLVPPLLKLLPSSASADVRRAAAACLNLMAREMPPGIHKNLEGCVLSDALPAGQQLGKSHE